MIESALIICGISFPARWRHAARSSSVAAGLVLALFIPALRVNRMFPAHVNVFGPAEGMFKTNP